MNITKKPNIVVLQNEEIFIQLDELEESDRVTRE